jgi:hypothetical protein
MTNETVAVVVTSIAAPNKALTSLASGCRGRNNYEFIVIGDEASPADFRLDGCDFYSLERQKQLPFKFARACPTRHYARKNIGYLIALSHGATVIIETDDDNLPYDSFWDLPRRLQSIPAVAVDGWVNVYRYFSDTSIWPRGLPLNEIVSEPAPLATFVEELSDCPIQQGLADANPDTDAVYRLTNKGEVYFAPDRHLALDGKSWSPFNSQNTIWWRDAFPLMYLPAYCSFRMTDIWRSFVAQRIAWANQWRVAFHSPTMWQERNAHDLMKDFRDEVPGYLNNARISDALGALTLPGGAANLGENLIACYEELVRLGVVGEKELELVHAWLTDVNELLRSGSILGG